MKLYKFQYSQYNLCMIKTFPKAWNSALGLFYMNMVIIKVSIQSHFLEHYKSRNCLYITYSVSIHPAYHLNLNHLVIVHFILLLCYMYTLYVQYIYIVYTHVYVSWSFNVITLIHTPDVQCPTFSHNF